MNPLRRSTLLFAVFLSFSAFAFGQTGFPTGITRGSSQIKAGPVNIDMATGNMVMDLPVRKKIGAFPFAYDLVYNLGNAGAANTAGVVQGAMTGGGFPVLQKPLVVLCSTPPNVTATYGDSLGFGFSAVDPLGGLHATVLDGPVRVGPEPGCGDVGPVTSVSNDGTGYTAIITGSALASGSLIWTVYNKQGLYTASTSNILSDADSNTASLSSGGTKTWTDTMGLPAMNIQLGGGSGASDNYYYADSSGTNQYFTVTYGAQQHVKTVFGCSAPLFPDVDAMRYLPRSIVTPVGTYSFTYELTGSSYGTDVTGRMAKITLPTGGYVSFTYTGGTLGFNCLSRVIPTLKVTVDDNNGNTNTTTYGNGNNVNYQDPCCSNYTVTVTGNADPDNGGAQNVTVNSFSGEFVTQSVAYQGTGGTPLSIVLTCYNGNTANCATNPPVIGNGYLITKTDTYTAYNATSITTANSKEEIITYDCFTVHPCYGNITSVANYDYGRALLSTTNVTYTGCGVDSAKYIFDKPCSVTTTDGSGHQLSQTLYTYNSTGHPTQTQKWVSGTTFLVYNATYNSNGTLATTTDPNLGITTYTYDGSCNYLVPTKTTYPTISGTTLTTLQTWDCDGGVVTSTTGMDGHSATMAYVDPLWRPSTFTDPASAATGFSYTPVTAESTLSFGSSASDALVTIDGLGRTHISQRRQQPSPYATFDSVETDYDVIGRVSRKTTLYAGTAGQANSTVAGTSYQYDALGRITSAVDGGSGQTTYIHQLNDVLVTRGPAPGTENPKQRQLEYDGLGRLTSVCEITGTVNGGASCGQNTTATGFSTTYAYSNNTVTVAQHANGSPTQTRTYTYDALGRLTSEVNPESGTTNYTYDSDSSGTCSGTYKGDLIRRNTPQGTTCYTYDKLHRLQSKTYPSNTYTDSKYFVYDAATVNGTVMSNVLGRMAEAYTCPPTGSCTTKKTDLGYSYTPRNEIQSIWEATPHSGGYLRVCASYWPNGLLKSLNCLASVPYVVYGSTDGTNSSGLDGEGRPTWVWTQSGNLPFASPGVTYNDSNSAQPIGAITQVKYSSGDSDSFSYDPATGRMTNFTATQGTNSSSGTLSWNSIGSLAHLTIVDTANATNSQTCNYAQDDLGRTVLNDCGAAWHQTFAFDPFGNIKKTATAGISFLPTYNQSTNQIQALAGCTPGSPSYDGNGNLTNDCSHTYSSDSDGRVTTIDGTNVTYDALGRAVEWNVGAGYEQVAYDPLNRKLALMNGISTLVKAFIPLPGGGTMVDTPGVLPAYYRHSDWLGNSRIATTQTQGLYYDGGYAAYGEPYGGTGTTDLDFTGQNQDTTVGLYDFLFRKYSDVQGRFISPDPSGLEAVDMTNPQSWNRYAYVVNDSLRLTDPFGLEPGGSSGSNSVPEQSCTTTAADGSMRCIVTAPPPNAPPRTASPSISAAGYSNFGRAMYAEMGNSGHVARAYRSTKTWARQHPKTVQAASIVGLVALAVVTDGASIPESLDVAADLEIAGEVTSIEPTTSVTPQPQSEPGTGKDQSLQGRQDQLTDMEREQNNFRSGKRVGPVDSIGKSQQNLDNALRELQGRSLDDVEQ
jgi:RHS repeat-associated protein